MTDRLVDTSRLYELLDRLADRIHGPRLLSDCHGRLGWPHRGVYFFYEGDENRSGSGAGARVVRVGTHALKYGSTSRLWGRLRTHRGPAGSGTGSHRSSIFRLLVGIALAKKNNIPLPTSWDVSGDPCQSCPPTGISRVQLLEEEADLEAHVSRYIGQMPFLWLNVDDAPGPASQRGFIERNAIALLSCFNRPALDQASTMWLGQYSDRERVRHSGLWNNNHVDEAYDKSFLDALQRHIELTSPL